MTKQVKLADDVYDRLSKLGNVKTTYSNAVKYLLDVNDNVEKLRINRTKSMPKVNKKK